MKNELKIPQIEAIPTKEMYGLEGMAYFPEPGTYKLKWGWDRAYFTEPNETGYPNCESENCSYIFNTHKNLKAVKVFAPCCMLVRQWDIIKNANDISDVNENCCELKSWKLEEYDDIDIRKLVEFYAPVIFKIDQINEQIKKDKEINDANSSN